MKIAIIGSGMAGTSCAYLLKQYGHECIVYESSPAIASQGSGNNLGLYNPRLSAEYTPEAELYKTAFELALKTFPALGETIEWNPCGALHLMTDDKRKIRYNKMMKSWDWDGSMMQIVTSKEASNLAGIPIDHDALFLPQSGSVSPKKLCAAYAKDTPVHLNHTIESLSDIDADIIIMACGEGVCTLAETQHLPVGTVRGQITEINTTDRVAPLKTALCYGGYTAPITNDVQHVGSTFQRWLDHTDTLDEDDELNMSKLHAHIPSLNGEYEVADRRAALRVTAPDHMPIIGKISDRLYVSTAHGSHGVLTTLIGAQIIASMIKNEPLPVSGATMHAIDPVRFG